MRMVTSNSLIRTMVVVLAFLFLALALLSWIVPVLSFSFFLFLSIICFLFSFPKEMKKIPFLSWIVAKKKLWKEEFQMKIFTFIIIKSLVVFMIIAIILKNYEFIYYGAILLPMVLLAYYLHRKIRLHLPVFILLCVVFIMHAAGGVVHIGGTRLYDITFSFIKFDNIVHFVGIFVTVFIVYNLVYDYIAKKKGKRTYFYVFLILVLMSTGVGTFIELIELVGVLFFGGGSGVGGYMNNATDLFVNLLGALAGAGVVGAYHNSKVFNDYFLRGKLSRAIGKKFS